MSPDQEPGTPQVRFGPIHWLNKPLRAALERAVSDDTGRAWQIKTEQDFSEFACHRAAIVSDGSYAVFFKYSESVEAKPQFEVELSGLKTLSAKAGVLVPRPIDIVPTDGGWLLIMEALKTIERQPRQWKEIGTALARIHNVRGETFGFEKDGFWGPLPQDNTPETEWLTFFRERRLRPLLGTAVDSGNLPAAAASDLEKLIDRLPELCGPGATPSLLHGDAQQNNFISTAAGVHVIDPAVFYGNREWDLALLDAWQPVPKDVFDAYNQVLPIAPGFAERRDLLRIPLYLAAVALEGEMHLKRLTAAVENYL